MPKGAKIPPFSETYSLCGGDIDRSSQTIFRLMLDSGMNRKNALRMRLAMEEILLSWQTQLGEDAACSISTLRRMGQNTLRLEIRGAQFNPLDSSDISQGDVLSGLGMKPQYRYHNGVNRVILQLPRRGISTPISILLAIAAAIIAGLALRMLPAETISFIDGGLLQPLINAFMRMLSAVAGPLVFLSIATGVFNIGDRASLGKLGGALVRSSILITLVLTIFPIIVAMPKFSFSGAGTGSASIFTDLMNMILDIIPNNIVSPFADGNSMQIILMAILLSLAVLTVSSRGSSISTLMQELNQAVQFIMGLVGRLLPGFIFMSITQMILNGVFLRALDTYRLVIQTLIACLVIMAVYFFGNCIQYRIRPAKLAKKLMPTFIIAASTASSAASFSTNMECCEKQLGISRRVTSFGIPLGQVIFMPGAMTMFLLTVLFTAGLFEIPITLGWIVTAVILCVVLAVAAPPVPGGAMTCYTILFTQMGLPMEYLPVILSISMLLEFPTTGLNIFCLQNQLIRIADHAGELNRETLKS